MRLFTGIGLFTAAVLLAWALYAQEKVEYSAKAEDLFNRALGLYTA